MKFENTLSFDDEMLFSRSKETLTHKDNRLIYVIGDYAIYQTETGDYDVIKSHEMIEFLEYNDSAFPNDFQEESNLNLPPIINKIFHQISEIKCDSYKIIGCCYDVDSDELYNYTLFDEAKNTYFTLNDLSKLESYTYEIPKNSGSIAKPKEIK